MQIKKESPPRCQENKYVAYYSFYALEPAHDNNITKNRFTIFFDSTDYFEMKEKSVRDDVGMAVSLGGVWIVYTGMSAVAVVHAVVLIILGM